MPLSSLIIQTATQLYGGNGGFNIYILTIKLNLWLRFWLALFPSIRRQFKTTVLLENCYFRNFLSIWTIAILKMQRAIFGRFMECQGTSTKHTKQRTSSQARLIITTIGLILVLKSLFVNKTNWMQTTVIKSSLDTRYTTVNLISLFIRNSDIISQVMKYLTG